MNFMSKLQGMLVVLALTVTTSVHAQSGIIGRIIDPSVLHAHQNPDPTPDPHHLARLRAAQAHSRHPAGCSCAAHRFGHGVHGQPHVAPALYPPQVRYPTGLVHPHGAAAIQNNRIREYQHRRNKSRSRTGKLALFAIGAAVAVALSSR